MSSTRRPPFLLNRRASCDRLMISPLGSGNEVGRSCVYMSYMGKSILFDCGIHPAYSGIAAFPFFDAIELSTIDVLLVTKFHLDHAASLPYLLEMTNFKGKVFMTHPTKAFYKSLLSDYVKVMSEAVENMYDERDFLPSLDKIEVIDFHQTVEVNGIRFWCYPAVDVLGGAMFMVEIAGVRVLYTGDYSCEEDRYLQASIIPGWFAPDICIIKSPYGSGPHYPRHMIEKRLTDFVHSIITQGGRVLIPAFALGRAALELLKILDEYWSNHPELHNIPIYHASHLAENFRDIYQTCTNSMADRIENSNPFDLKLLTWSQFAARSNPFDLKHISPLKSIKDFDDVGLGPCVVISGPSGLQSGLSREFFDMWCSEKKNACVILEYAVEGTLAQTILRKPKEVTLMNGIVAPLNLRMQYLPSFSGYPDFADTSVFLKELMPRNIILVDGKPYERVKLKQNLITMFSDHDTGIYSLHNREAVEIDFTSEAMAKTPLEA